MALTTEQQAQVDLEIALHTVRTADQDARDLKSKKSEMVRLAKEIIQENRRVAQVGTVSDITSSDITTLADSLLTYINS